MDTFIDKLGQKLTAQEMIRANSAADAAELSYLREQMAEYEDILKEIQEEIKLLCQASGDINRVEQLMQELSQLRAIRKQLIGDRVIIP